ncbi:MAG TPA: bacterioferritin [Candidatus Krumholzibacteria bacterium]|nr:bacterioferritin [Candidatus Krumholzibacteria bacterium]
MKYPHGEQILESLNQLLTLELTGVNQFFLHARMCRNWGYERLADTIRQRSIDEMKHAEKIIDRVLYLEGVPNLQRLDKIRLGENVPEILRLDYEHEKKLVDKVKEQVKLLLELGDHGSRQLVEEVLRGEENDIDWFESQFALIQQIGEANYLAQQVRGG